MRGGKQIAAIKVYRTSSAAGKEAKGRSSEWRDPSAGQGRSERRRGLVGSAWAAAMRASARWWPPGRNRQPPAADRPQRRMKRGAPAEAPAAAGVSRTWCSASAARARCGRSRTGSVAVDGAGRIYGFFFFFFFFCFFFFFRGATGGGCRCRFLGNFVTHGWPRREDAAWWTGGRTWRHRSWGRAASIRPLRGSHRPPAGHGATRAG